MNDWTAIVLIKPWRLSKRRLEMDPSDRVRLSEAFATDVLHALAGAKSVGAIVVVSSDPGAWRLAARVGAAVVKDRPLMAPDSMNRAVLAGAAWAGVRTAGRPACVVPADLPALTSTAVDDAVAQMAETPRWHVPDAAGTGTTLLAATEPAALHPRYGRGSAARHALSGSVAFTAADRRLRRDVDTTADLVWALDLGAGPATRQAVDDLTVARGRSA